MLTTSSLKRDLACGAFVLSVLALVACKKPPEAIQTPPTLPTFIHPDVSVSAYLATPENLTHAEQITAEWSMSVPLMIEGQEAVTEASSCEQALAAIANNARAQQPAMETTFRYAVSQCQAVKVATGMRPATKTFLQDAQLDQNTINAFPVDLAFIVSETEMERALEAHDTIGEAMPVRQCDAAGEFAMQCAVEGGLQQFKVLLRGDVNGDNIEDLVLEVNNSVVGGSYSATNVFVLTRKSGNTSAIVIDKY